jgi:hypothetical protein
VPESNAVDVWFTSAWCEGGFARLDRGYRTLGEMTVAYGGGELGNHFVPDMSRHDSMSRMIGDGLDVTLPKRHKQQDSSPILIPAGAVGCEFSMSQLASECVFDASGDKCQSNRQPVK